MRLIFVGSPPFAVPSLQRLLSSPFKPVAVVTQPDRPKGRGQAVELSEIAKLAKSASLPCFQPESAADPEFLKKLRDLKPDVIVVVSYGQILKDEFLSIPTKGCFNLHASLLPKYRGASPIAAAILAGDAETGVSIQRIVKKLDAGDVVAQKTLAILPQSTTGDLFVQLAKLGAELLIETLEKIESGEAQFTPQDEAKVSYAPKFKKESGLVDWKKTASEVDRHIRAMMPWPGAYTYFPSPRGQKRVAVLAGMPLTENSQTPGKVLHASGEGLDISCREGAYRIKAVHPEAARPMAIAQFLQGNPVKPGESL